MPTTLFISDLHLDPRYPQTTDLFLHLLQTHAKQADALYILGDFFEVWIGDDDKSPFIENIISALRALTQTGVPVYFMPGNRDFLIGDRFIQQTGCQLLHDPIVIDLYGVSTLLLHGDTLCTEDKAYLYFRRIVRNRRYQPLFLNLPLIIRRGIARFLRKTSQRYTRANTETRMDANLDEVKRLMQIHQVSLLIHGHTHRPSIQWMYSTKNNCRIVLGDWHHQGNLLLCTPEGIYRLLSIFP